jgi:large subunit ribosomal protein L15
MQLHELKPIHKGKKPKRVGRGGKRGTYSGRGLKGQKSRAGRKLRPAIRDLIKRYPKLRGFKFKSIGVKFSMVNVDVLEKKFMAGEQVSPKILVEKKLIRKIKGKLPKVKILGQGELTKKLVIEGCEVSKGAREKVEKIGGSIRI